MGPQSSFPVVRTSTGFSGPPEACTRVCACMCTCVEERACSHSVNDSEGDWVVQEKSRDGQTALAA